MSETFPYHYHKRMLAKHVTDLGDTVLALKYTKEMDLLVSPAMIRNWPGITPKFRQICGNEQL